MIPNSNTGYIHNPLLLLIAGIVILLSFSKGKGSQTCIAESSGHVPLKLKEVPKAVQRKEQKQKSQGWKLDSCFLCKQKKKN